MTDENGHFCGYGHTFCFACVAICPFQTKPNVSCPVVGCISLVNLCVIRKCNGFNTRNAYHSNNLLKSSAQQSSSHKGQTYDTLDGIIDLTCDNELQPLKKLKTSTNTNNITSKLKHLFEISEYDSEGEPETPGQMIVGYSMKDILSLRKELGVVEAVKESKTPNQAQVLADKTAIQSIGSTNSNTNSSDSSSNNITTASVKSNTSLVPTTSKVTIAAAANKASFVAKAPTSYANSVTTVKIKRSIPVNKASQNQPAVHATNATFNATTSGFSASRSCDSFSIVSGLQLSSVFSSKVDVVQLDNNEHNITLSSAGTSRNSSHDNDTTTTNSSSSSSSYNDRKEHNNFYSHDKLQLETVSTGTKMITANPSIAAKPVLSRAAAAAATNGAKAFEESIEAVNVKFGSSMPSTVSKVPINAFIPKSNIRKLAPTTSKMTSTQPLPHGIHTDSYQPPPVPILYNLPVVAAGNSANCQNAPSSVSHNPRHTETSSATSTFSGSSSSSGDSCTSSSYNSNDNSSGRDSVTTDTSYDYSLTHNHKLQPYSGPVHVVGMTFGTATYTGQLVNGKRHGRGKMTYTIKSFYDGEWKNDKRDGYGIMKEPQAPLSKQDPTPRYVLYTGMWVADKQCGHGVLRHGVTAQDISALNRNNNSVINGVENYVALDYDVYVGDFRLNRREGKGTQYYNAGGVKEMYSGDWVANKSHGHGTYTFATAGVYTGSYSHDKMNGYGVMRYSDGKVYDGNWKNELFEGEGCLSYPNNERPAQRGLFRKNKFIGPI